MEVLLFLLMCSLKLVVIKCLIMLCWGRGCLCSLPNIAQKILWYGREKKKCVKFGSVVVVHSASTSELISRLHYAQQRSDQGSGEIRV